MRSSVLLLPLLVLAFQSHQTAGRVEPALKPVTEAGWRGLLPVSGLDPQPDDPTRPGCPSRAGRADTPAAEPRPARPGRPSGLSGVAAGMGRYTAPFLAGPAADSAGTRHGVSS
jgi:hypothetical protein